MAASLRRGTKEPEPLPLLLLKLQHLLQFIEHELNLRPDDNLAGSLGRADDTGSTGSPLTAFSFTAEESFTSRRRRVAQ